MTKCNQLLLACQGILLKRGLGGAGEENRSLLKNLYRRLCLRLFDWVPVRKYDYEKVCMDLYTEEDKKNNIYPTIIPNWDRSPRAGNRAIIWYNYSPDYFKKQVQKALDIIKNKPYDHRILFLMSWNEWGEGNYMEPDLEFGKGYINALKEAIVE